MAAIHGSAGCSLSDSPAETSVLVGAETCCQTVQKVGEVRLEIIRPEIVEAVGGGQVIVRQNRRFQGVSESSFRLEIHGSAGCSLSDSPAEPSISRCF